MLCTYLAGHRWRWLTTHPSVRGDQVLLVEREGACPGDPGGHVTYTSRPVAPGQVPGASREWLAHGVAQLARESPVDADRPPVPTRDAVARASVDRPIDPAVARRAARSCLFGNPAAAQQH